MKKSHALFVIWSALIIFAIPTFSAELRISREENILPYADQSFVVYIDSLDFDLEQFDLFITIDQRYYGLISIISSSQLDSCGITNFHYQVWNHDTLGVLGHDIGRFTDGIEISGTIDSPNCGLTDGRLELARINYKAVDHMKLMDYECQIMPIKFYWRDCLDNSLTLADQSKLTVGELYQWYDYYFENDTTSISFPGFGITGADCTPAISSLTAINGLLEVSCYTDSYWWLYSMSGLPGDINLNDIPFELSDLLLFGNYYIYGLAVFNINTEGQVASTDINQDGLVLSLPDFVEMMQIVLGHKIPAFIYSPKTTDNLPISFDVQNGLLTTIDPADAALVIYEGEVIPRLLNESADMISNFDQIANQTRVLVQTTDFENGMTGNLLTADGDIVSVEVASINGSSSWTKQLPSSISLHQNYPNPFNPSTSISFDLPTEKNWEISIYNLTGRRIRVFQGRNQGKVEINWDGTNEEHQLVASGIYFYQLQFEDQTLSRKMLLIK